MPCTNSSFGSKAATFAVKFLKMTVHMHSSAFLFKMLFLSFQIKAISQLATGDDFVRTGAQIVDQGCFHSL